MVWSPGLLVINRPLAFVEPSRVTGRVVPVRLREARRQVATKLQSGGKGGRGKLVGGHTRICVFGAMIRTVRFVIIKDRQISTEWANIGS